jgi:hypothetical protein
MVDAFPILVSNLHKGLLQVGSEGSARDGQFSTAKDRASPRLEVSDFKKNLQLDATCFNITI